MFMEQVTRYNNVAQEVNIQIRINVQNCMTKWMVMEQVTRYINMTISYRRSTYRSELYEEQVTLNRSQGTAMLHRRSTYRSESTNRSEMYDEQDGHGAGHTIQQCHTGGQYTGQNQHISLNCMRYRVVIEHTGQNNK